MLDILGRKTKQGDLVVMMAIGNDSPGMCIGVMFSDSTAKCVKLSYNGSKKLSSVCCKNIYLIENPTDKELAIKAEILSLHRAEMGKKINAKPLPKKALIVGHVYFDFNGLKWVYLGKRTVTIFRSDCIGVESKIITYIGETYAPYCSDQSKIIRLCFVC